MNPDPELSGNVRVELLQDAFVKHIIILKLLVRFNHLESLRVGGPNFHHHWKGQQYPYHPHHVHQFVSNPNPLGRSVL